MQKQIRMHKQLHTTHSFDPSMCAGIGSDKTAAAEGSERRMCVDGSSVTGHADGCKSSDVGDADERASVKIDSLMSKMARSDSDVSMARCSSACAIVGIDASI